MKQLIYKDDDLVGYFDIQEIPGGYKVEGVYHGREREFEVKVETRSNSLSAALDGAMDVLEERVFGKKDA